MPEKNQEQQQKAVSKNKPMSEHFKKINKEAAIGIMKHKDGRIEKRKL